MLYTSYARFVFTVNLLFRQEMRRRFPAAVYRCCTLTPSHEPAVVPVSMRGVSMKVLVVGGGPAGSVTATALAQAGLTVSLIDGAEFPRYHIGESLTPSCRAVLEAVGVARKVDEHGFVIKHGGAFRWNSDSWLFDWG